MLQQLLESIAIAEAADAAAAQAIINAETAQGHAEDAQTAAEESAEDAAAALAQVADKVSTTQLAGELALKVDKIGAVTGIKGNAESTYRTGNINITAANIGTLTQAQITSLIEGIPSAIRTFADTTQLVDWLNGDYERPDGILPASRLSILTLPQNEPPDYWVVNTPPQSLEDLHIQVLLI